MVGCSSGRLWLAAAFALVAACTPIGSTRPVTTAATDPATVRLPDFTDSGHLESALTSFGECVEESFPIVMRFRTDFFIGLQTEVASQRTEDSDRVDSAVAVCMGRFDLDRRLSVYQSEHPITPAMQREMADDFVSCATAVSSQMSDLVSGEELHSLESVSRFLADLRPGDGGLPASELVAISDCHSDLTGPEYVFADGHPWFTR